MYQKSFLLTLFLSLLSLFNTSNASKDGKKKQEHHLHKKGLFTSDGEVYSEYFITSTLPPVTYYFTSYWTSYYTFAVTQLSTITLGDSSFTTKTYIAPSTSTSIVQTSGTSSTSTSSSSSCSSTSTTSSTNYFQDVATPVFVTQISDSATQVFYYEDVYYDTAGNATTTMFEEYIGTGTPSVSIYTTSTSTQTVYVTISSA